MKKKLAIIGKGTAGTFALTHFLRWTDWEITVYHDPKIATQPVGEGSTLDFPANLYNNINFLHSELKHLDGSPKTGIRKIGWTTKGGDWVHNFSPPSVGYHFSALKFQEYIFEKCKGRFKIVEQNISDNDKIDADYIFDCSGKPSSYEDFDIPEGIPVNAVHVTQCFWDAPRFTETLTIARPYGWVFGIPLNNRCSIGYMYNHDINTLEEVKEDVKQIFEDFNLTPSTTTNSFQFKNYFRKQNYGNRIIYNGNSSFFLEPLEATSIAVMNIIQREAFDIWNGNVSTDFSNSKYTALLLQTQAVIMLHYLAGSTYDTEFWRFAKKRAKKTIKSIVGSDERLVSFIQDSKNDFHKFDLTGAVGTWGSFSFKQNLTNLNLYPTIDKLLKERK